MRNICYPRSISMNFACVYVDIYIQMWLSTYTHPKFIDIFLFRPISYLKILTLISILYDKMNSI